MNSLANTILHDLTSGPIRIAERLIEIPLLGVPRGPRLVLLHRAIAEGTARVTEVDEKGVVGRLRVENRGELPLLLIQGEELRGAKQDRVLNRSVLLQPGQEIEVPVSCVERGRWRRESQALHSSGRTLPSNLRKRFARRVLRNEARGLGSDSDQGATWHDVDRFLETTRSHSPTSSIGHALDDLLSGVQVARALVPFDEQVGGIYLHERELLGMERLGRPGAWSQGWQVIARGHALMPDRPRRRPRLELRLERDEALDTIREELASARWWCERETEEFQDVFGSALLVGHEPVHVAVWPC
jgi:hypothetical protein